MVNRLLSCVFHRFAIQMCSQVRRRLSEPILLGFIVKHPDLKTLKWRHATQIHHKNGQRRGFGLFLKRWDQRFIRKKYDVSLTSICILQGKCAPKTNSRSGSVLKVIPPRHASCILVNLNTKTPIKHEVGLNTFNKQTDSHQRSHC